MHMNTLGGVFISLLTSRVLFSVIFLQHEELILSYFAIKFCLEAHTFSFYMFEKKSLFSFHFWSIFSLDIEFLFGIFFYKPLITLYHCPLILTVSNEMSVLTLIIVLYVMCFYVFAQWWNYLFIFTL